MFSNFLSMVMPALFTSTSADPKASMTSSRIASTAS